MSVRYARKHGILTPLSPSVAHDGIVSDNSRKRKRGNEEDGGNLGSTWTAKPYPSSSTCLPLKLEPLCSIPRANLPLTWLDTSNLSTLFPSTTICKLEATVQDLTNGPQHVRVARRITDGEMFTLEHMERDVYMAIKLADWVTGEMLGSLVEGITPSSMLRHVLAAQAMANRLQNGNAKGASDIQPRFQEPAKKEPKMKKGALARMEILPRREAIETETSAPQPAPWDQSISQKPTSTPTELSITAPSAQALEPSRSFAAASSPSRPDQGSPHQTNLDVQEIFENLHARYLDTLYISKTSVAYFAKGPLARARATFTPEKSVESATKLADFYRGRVLPLKKLDLKFKESLLECVRAHKDESPSRPKRRKKSNTKLGKNGLYSDEAGFIQQWWQAANPSNTDCSTVATLQQVRNLSRDLRSRETQLQIMMVLEAMILELPCNSNIKAEVAELDLKDIPTKKKQDLKTHLDLLVDRLCIAQTVAFDNLTDDDQPGREKSDKLRDFCAEVIIPFYASKLPEQCKGISKKLGGPSEIASKSSRAPLKKSTSTSKVMPGTEIKRMHPAPTRLQRSMTDNFNRSRSPSVPLPLLKREPSERPTSRGGIHKNKLLENRQVDLVAVAKHQESKMKKLNALAEQKRQLDDAISMLRKPNRGMVAKGIVEEAEKRQDLKNSVPSRSHTGIQVTATPRKKKPGETQFGGLESIVDIVPEIMAIPSSTVRPSHALGEFSSNRGQGVQETPSRKTNPTMIHSALESQKQLAPPMRAQLLTTPVKGRTSTLTPPSIVGLTPQPSRTTPEEPLGTITNTPFASRLRMTKSQKPVSFTPLKKSDGVVMDVFTKAPEVEKGVTNNEDDIYARLGWMDDGFDL